MIQGCWSSDTFLLYIRLQVKQFITGLSEGMVRNKQFFTIHDSILTTQKYKDQLYDVMNTVLTERTGIKPGLTVENIKEIDFTQESYVIEMVNRIIKDSKPSRYKELKNSILKNWHFLNPVCFLGVLGFFFWCGGGWVFLFFFFVIFFFFFFFLVYYISFFHLMIKIHKNYL